MLNSPFLTFRRLFILMFLPRSWSNSRKRTASALLRFQSTEIDSAWQNLYILNNTKHDPKHCAKMFQHVLEEIHHAALFSKLVKNYSDDLLPIPSSERDPLYINGSDEKKALKNFFTYEYVGEADVSHQFSTYERAAPFEDIKKVFGRLRVDEMGHVRYTKSVFYELVTSKWERFTLLFKIRIKRAYESWLRLGNTIGIIPSEVLLRSVYFVFGWTLARQAKERLDQNINTREIS
jgi:hypothetical protein